MMNNNLDDSFLQPLPMDEKLKRDIKIIQMRNYLDPKRFLFYGLLWQFSDGLRFVAGSTKIPTK